MDVYWLFLEFCNISTIVLCLILKVPQIWNIISSRSVQGLSIPGILLELSAWVSNVGQQQQQQREGQSPTFFSLLTFDVILTKFPWFFLFRFSIGLVYNIYKQYPLFQYLEYPFLVLQDVLLLAIVLHFSKQLGLFSLAGFALYGAVLYAMSTGMFPSAVIVTLMVIKLS